MNTKFAHVDCLAISENIRLPAQCFAVCADLFNNLNCGPALRADLFGQEGTAAPPRPPPSTLVAVYFKRE